MLSSCNHRKSFQLNPGLPTNTPETAPLTPEADSIGDTPTHKLQLIKRENPTLCPIHEIEKGENDESHQSWADLLEDMQLPVEMKYSITENGEQKKRDNVYKTSGNSCVERFIESTTIMTTEIISEKQGQVTEQNVETTIDWSLKSTNSVQPCEHPDDFPLREMREKSRRHKDSGYVDGTMLCTSTHLLKRYPLPTEFSWNGQCGKDFEIFIQKFEGHIIQQAHMGYLICDKIATLWLTYGNPEIVLKLGIIQRIHPGLIHISCAQFESDVAWLYGAMKQSITGRGYALIKYHEATQDGILTWRQFISTYRYHGDVETYISKQLEIVNCKFHEHYPGGMLKFLEDYDNAFINIDYATRGHSKKERNLIFTDNGKRETFVHNFCIPGLTTDLIEDVEQNTSTWDDMVFSLQRRLARRISYSQNHAYSVSGIREGLTSEEFQRLTSNIRPGLKAQEWKIGSKLLKGLSKDLIKQIEEARDQLLLLDHKGGVKHFFE